MLPMKAHYFLYNAGMLLTFAQTLDDSKTISEFVAHSINRWANICFIAFWEHEFNIHISFYEIADVTCDILKNSVAFIEFKFANVNNNVFLSALFQFCKSSGTLCVQPFMPVFARQLGFSTFVVGTIYSILPILGLVSKPLFGALADRYVYKNFLRFFLVRLRFTCKKNINQKRISYQNW